MLCGLPASILFASFFNDLRRSALSCSEGRQIPGRSWRHGSAASRIALHPMRQEDAKSCGASCRIEPIMGKIRQLAYSGRARGIRAQQSRHGQL